MFDMYVIRFSIILSSLKDMSLSVISSTPFFFSPFLMWLLEMLMDILKSFPLLKIKI